MRKTVLLPTWAESPSDAIDNPPSAYAVVTHKHGYRHVRFSGGTARGDDVADQVRTVLERRRRALQDLGGGLDDVVFIRYYLGADHISRESQAHVHEVIADLFERPDVPAATMVGVADLLGEALVELEVEAEIPDEKWDTQVMTEKDAGR